MEKLIPGMILWENVHEELESEKMPYILEVNEIIWALDENEKATIMEKEHASIEDNVLKYLHDHNYSILGKHECKDHYPFRSLKSQAGI